MIREISFQRDNHGWVLGFRDAQGSPVIDVCIHYFYTTKYAGLDVVIAMI